MNSTKGRSTYYMAQNPLYSLGAPHLPTLPTTLATGGWNDASIRGDFNLFSPLKYEGDMERLEIAGMEDFHFRRFSFFSLGCQKRLFHILLDYDMECGPGSPLESLT